MGGSLLGKDVIEIAAALGLPSSEYQQGATIYKFARLPAITEYEYELTADYPDGGAYNPAHNDPKYKPGSNKINQWKIHPQIRILPGKRIPYDWLMR